MIKNLTPYKGKLKLKFEKDPEYTGGNSGVLNKVHIDLGFTKLVSRMIPRKNKDGWEIDLEKSELIEKFTGGKLGFYEWWTIKKEDGAIVETNSAPQNSETIIFHGSLPNTFMTLSGKFIGDVRRAWWYYTNLLKVCEDYPHGVAEKYDNGKLIGYYGYTHRGGQLFKIGNRLFDENYVPKEEDYLEWEWIGWEDDLNRAYENADDLTKEWIDASGMAYVIPYAMRGSKIIEELDDAKRAAINFSKYLS